MLLRYQDRWVKDRAPIKVYEKSRRIGITWSSACEAVIAAAGGEDVWYIGYDEKMGKEFIRDCKDWARHIEATCGRMMTTQDDVQEQVRFKSGKRITSLASTTRSVRGKQGYVIIDEAAFHDDLDGLLKSAIAMVMLGGRVALLSTHFGTQNFFNRIIDETRSGKRGYSLHRTTIDDALSDGYYRMVCMKQGITWSQERQDEYRRWLIDDVYAGYADEELLCIPNGATGSYFSHELCLSAAKACDVHRWDFTDDEVSKPSHEHRRAAERRVIEANIKQTRGVSTVIGVDFGRTQDLTCVCVLSVNQKLIAEPCAVFELHNAPFSLQREIIIAIASQLSGFCGMALDATGNGAWLAEEMERFYGDWLVEKISINNRWLAEAFGSMRNAMQNRTLYVPRDKDILNDVLSVQMIDGIPKIPKTKNKSEQAANGRMKTRHGDAAMAIALAATQAFGKCVGSADIVVPQRRGNHEQESKWF